MNLAKLSFLTMIACAMSAQVAIGQLDDLRELSGLTEQDVAAVGKLQTFDPSNTQFKKLLYRTGTVDSVVMRQWANRSQDVSLKEIESSPASHCFHPFSFEASANSIFRFDFSEADAKNFLRGFYVAQCETKLGNRFLLLSRSSVSTWPKNETLDTPQSIRFDGFFFGKLDRGSSLANGNAEDESLPVFIARRFEWHPNDVCETLGVDTTTIALSKSGVDISLLDVVKSRKGKSIGTREATCFWQMLAASKKLSNETFANYIDFATMLRKPLDSVGKAASVRGRVRQCVPVKVTSPEAIDLLGTDTWYQLTIFPDLDGRPIKVATRDGDPEVYRNAFPVTVCVIDLPEGFDADTIVGNTFRYNGFFYRIWAYPSERTDDSGLDEQPSPLIMASSLVRIESSTGQLQTLLSAVLLSIAIAVGVIGWFVFRTRKSAKRTELPETIETW